MLDAEVLSLMESEVLAAVRAADIGFTYGFCTASNCEILKDAATIAHKRRANYAIQMAFLGCLENSMYFLMQSGKSSLEREREQKRRAAEVKKKQELMSKFAKAGVDVTNEKMMESQVCVDVAML
jgi:hypothetical protein